MNKTKYFEINCTINGEIMSLKLPQQIYADYEKTLQSKDGLSTLCSIFDLYSKFNDFHRMDFQELIFEYPNKIKCLRDVFCLLWAYIIIAEEDG